MTQMAFFEFRRTRQAGRMRLGAFFGGPSFFGGAPDNHGTGFLILDILKKIHGGMLLGWIFRFFFAKRNSLPLRYKHVIFA